VQNFVIGAHESLREGGVVSNFGVWVKTLFCKIIASLIGIGKSSIAG